jgi:hypothetical protein
MPQFHQPIEKRLFLRRVKPHFFIAEILMMNKSTTALLFHPHKKKIHLLRLPHHPCELTTPGLLLFSLAGNGANRVPFPAV